MKKIIYLLVGLLATLCIIFYHNRVNKVLDVTNFAWLSFSDANPLKERACRAEKAKGDIVIGVAGPWKIAQFRSVLDGVRLAADEINASGGILGRKIVLIESDDQGREDVGEMIAQKFCNNMDMIAVLGHMTSLVSESAAPLYDYNGLPMITPMSTDAKVLSYRPNGLIFRNNPVSEEYAKILMEFMRMAGLSKLIVYNDNDGNYIGLADMVCRYAHMEGMIIVDRRKFDSTSNNVYFKRDLEEWKFLYGKRFDSILIIGPVDKTAEVLKEARTLDMSKQFFSIDISPDVFIKTSGKMAEDVIISSFDTSSGPAGPREHFREAFIKKFGHEPDYNAIRGYDTLKVIANAIVSAGSSIPSKIAAALVNKTYQGLFGPVSFDHKGELVQKRCAIYKIKNSRAIKLKRDEWGKKQ